MPLIPLPVRSCSIILQYSALLCQLCCIIRTYSAAVCLFVTDEGEIPSTKGTSQDNPGIELYSYVARTITKLLESNS